MSSSGEHETGPEGGRADSGTSRQGRVVRAAREGGCVSAALSVLAGCVVWAALVMPTDPARTQAAGLLRIPVEGVVLTVLALVLPSRVRRGVALALGVLLGVLTLLKGLDAGFQLVLLRPFDMLNDWSYLPSAAGVLTDWIGLGWTALVVVVVGLLAALVLAVLPVATARAMTALARHRGTVAIVFPALTATVLATALPGVSLVPASMLFSASTSAVVADTAGHLQRDLADRAIFARQIATDPVAEGSAAAALSGLRGKDVLLVFVESYGRVALDDPELAPSVRSALGQADEDLRRAGFITRSAYLESPTFGGVSWLAHATVQSGLWVDSQQRYNQLLTAERLTLTRAFGAAGWRTVVDAPAIDRPWPAGRSFYGFDTAYTSTDVGYHGPRFGYATMPDQYTLEAFADRELAPGHQGVMAEIDLLSSHYPWTSPPPLLLPRGTLGDGSVFARPEARAPDALATQAPSRAIYAASIGYAVRAVASFVASSDDPDLVVLVMGDHQPKSPVTSSGASRQVPVMLITADPQVLHRTTGWGWTPGLDPGPDAPVWPMSAVRDRVLTDLGSSGTPGAGG